MSLKSWCSEECGEQESPSLHEKGGLCAECDRSHDWLLSPVHDHHSLWLLILSLLVSLTEHCPVPSVCIVHSLHRIAGNLHETHVCDFCEGRQFRKNYVRKHTFLQRAIIDDLLTSCKNKHPRNIVLARISINHKLCVFKNFRLYSRYIGPCDSMM